VGSLRYGRHATRKLSPHNRLAGQLITPLRPVVFTSPWRRLSSLPGRDSSRPFFSFRGDSSLCDRLHGTRSESAARMHGPFWEAESCDHAVRDDREWDRIKRYIENHPVRAGLVANAEDYLWWSAARKAEMNLGPAGLTACATVK
jgi:hypothetical protein